MFSHPPLSGEVTTWTCWRPTPPGRYEPVASPLVSSRLVPASTHRYGSSTYAPSSLDSSIDHRAFGLTGLPWTFGSIWVGYRQASATDLRAVLCPPPLWLRQAPPPPSVAPAHHPLLSGCPPPPRGIIAASPLRLPRSSAHHHRLELPSPSRLLPPSTPRWAFGMAEL